jgi:hypothetical protein
VVVIIFKSHFPNYVVAKTCIASFTNDVNSKTFFHCPEQRGRHQLERSPTLCLRNYFNNLHSNFVRSMMGYACPIRRSPVRSHDRKMQALQDKCLCFATNARWHVSNRKTHNNLGKQFCADCIRALTEGLDSKIADAGNSLVRQLGRHLCQPRAL